MTKITRARRIVGLLAAVVLAFPANAPAQRRGQYTPGMNATNSGTLPQQGLSYMNYFQIYSFNKLKGPNGARLPVSGNFSVLIDQNLFIWTTKSEALGAKIAFLADLPIANSSLTSAESGAIAGGAGLADTFFQPITLGWEFERADIQAGYGFFAPTGRFEGGASDNVGTGYWGHSPVAGQTVYLTKDKMNSVSVYELYEFHGKQKDTDIRPGQTFNIDYSATHTFPLKKNMESLLQIGVVAYGQYQTTDRRGPGLNPATEANTHYRVNAIGAGANVILPVRKTTMGVRYYQEFSNQATVEGHSLQIYGVITF